MPGIILKTFLIFVLLISNSRIAAQLDVEIASVIAGLRGPSELVTKDSSAARLIGKGEKILAILSEKFTDTSRSRVFSACSGRYLTQGEIAIILADRIEEMPYFLLTNMENCTMDFCRDNPNLVEYYLDYLRFRGMQRLFQQRYQNWLVSADRMESRGRRSKG